MAVDHNNPQSRDEEILIATIDGNEYDKAPQSRMEELLLELKETIEEGGGGGGTTNYENLSNQPQVNGETLIGDKTGADLGLVDAEEGKGLSTNDYNDTEKAAVAAATSAISAMKDGSELDSFGDVEVALLDKADVSDLGTAAAKDSTNAVTSGSTDLVESGAVKDAIDAAVAAAYHHAGTKTVAQLTHDLLIAANEGNVYNITDSGTTTSDFIEGIGKTIDEGSNVGICKVGNTYMFDLLSGFVDTTNFVQKSVTAGLLKNDGTVNDEIEEDVDSLKSGLTTLDNEVNGDATVYPYADVITIEDAVPANVADCNVKIEPVQDLHGQSAPYVGGAGKNKLPLVLADLKSRNTSGSWSGNVYTNNDVTFTCNQDDAGNITSVTANGLASAGTTFIVGYISNISGNYIFNGITGGSSNTYAMDYYGTGGSPYAKFYSGDKAISLESKTALTFRLNISEGYTCSNVTFYPMIRLSTETDATFAPYTNICPISGYSEASVQRDGRNLLPTLSAQTTVNGITYTPNSDGSITLNGTATKFSNVDLGRGTLTLPAGQYTSSAEKKGVGNVLFVTYKNTSPAQTITGLGGFTLTETTDIFFRIGVESGTTLTNVTVYPQIEAGDTSTSYVPHEQTYTIALGDTIYGGTVDFDSGVMTVDRAIVDMSTLSWETRSTYGDKVLYSSRRLIDRKISSDVVMLCEKYKYNGIIGSLPDIQDSDIGVYAYYLSAQPYSSSIYCITTDDDTVSGNIVYPLATPTTIQLTPQQIQLLKGTNTLYASTGQISVTVNGVSGAIGSVQEQVNEISEAGDVYSATGVKIGTWLGDDLYRKVISLGALPNDDTKLVSLAMAIDEKPLFFTAFATNATGNVQPLPYVDDYAKNADVLCDIVTVVDGVGFNMRIITAYNKSSYNGYCILYYTKTT